MQPLLLPGWYGVYLDLGHKYRESHLCAPAVAAYRDALARKPDVALGRAGLTACLLELGDYPAARREARLGYATGGMAPTFRYMSRVADSALTARRPGADSGGRR